MNAKGVVSGVGLRCQEEGRRGKEEGGSWVDHRVSSAQRLWLSGSSASASHAVRSDRILRLSGGSLLMSANEVQAERKRELREIHLS